MAIHDYEERLTSTVLRPLTYTSRGYYAFMLFLLALVLWGMFAYVTQLRHGLIVTGMRNVVLWGLYITNFVFFIGISHAGTLISAILRVSHVAWRQPITRMAEIITVVALGVGALMPMIDMGRPDRIPNLFLYGRFQSPLLWDVLAITTYLTGSLFYLYLPLIPDFALMRDRLGPTASRLKRQLYTALAAGWRGTDSQKRRLEKGIGIMAVVIIPIAVSVHTVVSWIFAMTVRPGWNSTIFGPYFVVGAIFSGIASIIIMMALFRKIFHLEEYITQRHFHNLGILLGVLLLVYAYFTFSEYLTMAYKLEIEEKKLLTMLFIGDQAPWFWLFTFTGIVIPGILILNPRTRTIRGMVVASLLVNLAMWVKRFVIIVPTLKVPLMPFEFGTYTPTWVEWSITLAAFAGFVLLYAVLAKLIPVISIWEVKEEAEKKAAERTAVPELRPAPQPSTRFSVLEEEEGK